MSENAGRRLAKNAANRLQAVAPFPTFPELCALPCAKSNTIIRSLHAHRSTSSRQGTCCDDQLRSPARSDIRAHRLDGPEMDPIRQKHQERPLWLLWLNVIIYAAFAARGMGNFFAEGKTAAFKNYLRIRREEGAMLATRAIIVFAIFALRSFPAFAADGITSPNFSSASAGWTTPIAGDFVPVPGAPGPVLSDSRYPFLNNVDANARGMTPNYRIGDLANPNLR